MSVKPLNLVAPNLPIPPETYSRQYHDQLNNILRLYFNQINNSINSEQSEEDKAYLVSQLTPANLEGLGAKSFVTDSTVGLAAGIGNVVIGGGTNKVPIYSDGVNWRIG